jgi:hypothetical protein
MQHTFRDGEGGTCSTFTVGQRGTLAAYFSLGWYEEEVIPEFYFELAKGLVAQFIVVGFFFFGGGGRAATLFCGKGVEYSAYPHSEARQLLIILSGKG